MIATSQTYKVRKRSAWHLSCTPGVLFIHSWSSICGFGAPHWTAAQSTFPERSRLPELVSLSEEEARGELGSCASWHHRPVAHLDVFGRPATFNIWKDSRILPTLQALCWSTFQSQNQCFLVYQSRKIREVYWIHCVRRCCLVKCLILFFKFPCRYIREVCYQILRNRVVFLMIRLATFSLFSIKYRTFW